MKILSFHFVLLIFIASACASLKKTSDNIQIEDAGYHQWSHPPVQSSTVPEEGINVSLIVKNWPDGASPQSIIYNHRKSSSPAITDTTKQGVVMSARIITSSSVVRSKAEKTELSDRLIYKTSEDSSEFLLIKKWSKVQP